MRRGAGLALGASAASLLVACGPRAPVADRAAPPVHEVATDWRDPLMPSLALLRLRGPRAAPVEAAPAVPEGPRPGFLGRLVAEVNARACPGARPVFLRAPPSAAFARLAAAVRDARWTPVETAPSAGRLEATRSDPPAADLIARVRSDGHGARIDLRAVSRSEAADGGADCRRVVALVAALVRPG